ncbi:hypothetical protein D3C71_221290 [compost metagenome]
MTPLQLNDALGIFVFCTIIAVLWFRAHASENPDYSHWMPILWSEFRAPHHGPDPAHGPGSRWWLCVRATIALGLMRAGPDMYAHELANWGRRVADINAGPTMSDWNDGCGYQELRVSGWRYVVYVETAPC